MAGKPSATPSTYSPSSGKKRHSNLADSDWVRPDGRGLHQCRPAFLRTGAVNSASGSAYAEFGNTKVIVSVFGPRESKKAMMYSDSGRLNCNVTYATFATPIRNQAPETKDLSSMLHKALEGAIILKSFPKTTVDVFALVLESGGSDLPVITSCACLALADAGIMLYDMVASVSVNLNSFNPDGWDSDVELICRWFSFHHTHSAYLDGSGLIIKSCLGKNLLMDPVSEEEGYQDGSLLISCMPSRNEVTQMTITGEWSTPKIHEAMQLGLDACSKLGKIMRSCLKEALSGGQD